MNKIVSTLLFLSLVSILSCERKPFVEHKLKFEKCLPADFKDEQMTTERKCDTVIVIFKTASADPGNKVYHITLDIDSYPRYQNITIDGDNYTITSSEK